MKIIEEQGDDEGLGDESKRTNEPTHQPTHQPTEQASMQASVQITEQPTKQPSVQTTEQSIVPSNEIHVQVSEPVIQVTAEQPTAQPSDLNEDNNIEITVEVKNQTSSNLLNVQKTEVSDPLNASITEIENKTKEHEHHNKINEEKTQPKHNNISTFNNLDFLFNAETMNKINSEVNELIEYNKQFHTNIIDLKKSIGPSKDNENIEINEDKEILGSIGSEGMIHKKQHLQIESNIPMSKAGHNISPEDKKSIKYGGVETEEILNGKSVVDTEEFIYGKSIHKKSASYDSANNKSVGSNEARKRYNDTFIRYDSTSTRKDALCAPCTRCTIF